MITIALDENGDFEGLNRESDEATFLAGLLYDDNGDEMDTANERERIIAYYQNVCVKAGGHFPESLHISHAGNNGSYVAKTKKEVGASLGEFLRNGTYQKKALTRFPRRGKYILFMQIKSNQGKRSLQGKDLCKLVKDDFASNLYMHMAEDVVSRLIFHNPHRPDIRKVHFDLPTRMVVLDNKLRDKINEYYQLGYKDYKFDKEEPRDIDKKKYLQIANDNNYRAAISREIIAEGRTDIEVDRMSVNSIYYGPANDKKIKSMVFLYLADSICSLLNWNRTGNSPVDWLNCFAEQAHELNGSSQNLFFAYDDVDVLFDQAWRAYAHGDYFTALQLSFEAKKSSSRFVAFYQKYWFPLLENALCRHADKDALVSSLSKFQQYSYSENLQQDCLIYIFEKLRDTVENQLSEGQLDKAAAFEFYDAGFSACNHTGHSDIAGKCFEKCKELASAVDIEMYLRTLNKYSVWRNDVLDFEAAKEVAEIIVIYADELRQMRGRLFGNEASGSVTYGRALSQCGQAYAFLKDTQAEESFVEALGHFDKSSADYFITLSYLLHYYIEQGNAEKYDEYAAIYFGGEKDAQKQFDFLMKSGQGDKPRFTLKFAFFVFLKGLCKLHRDRIKGSLRTDLLDIEKTFRRYHAEDQINGHPWEILYKYLAILAHQQRKEDIAKAYMEKSASIIKDGGPIIAAIVANGKREFLELTGDKEAASPAEADMVKNFRQSGSELSDKEIAERLCYMYD